MALRVLVFFCFLGELAVELALSMAGSGKISNIVPGAGLCWDEPLWCADVLLQECLLWVTGSSVGVGVDRWVRSVRPDFRTDTL